MGMGPNQFFNNDLKDRAVFLVAALTRNVGFHGGNVGSYAGNYRTAFFSGMPQYIAEDPFNIETRPEEARRVTSHLLPRRVGPLLQRRRSHPAHGQALADRQDAHAHADQGDLVSNSNSLMGTAKGHYDNVVNGYPRVDFIAVSEWWWTASCEYADIVFPVDSVGGVQVPGHDAERDQPVPLRLPGHAAAAHHDTRSDIEVMAGSAARWGG
jgi:nitrate reductase / nitrite oxidoreductase, alpha subunit